MMTQSKYERMHEHSTRLFSEEQIDAALANMAEAITPDLTDKNPVVISVLMGALMMTEPLVKRLNFPLELDCVRTASYENEAQGEGLNWLLLPTTDLHGRTVLIVDDVLDSGRTLKHVIDKMIELGAVEVQTAILIDKERPREEGAPESATYTGLTTDAAHWLYGFGMDCFKGGRALKDVWVADKAVIAALQAEARQEAENATIYQFTAGDRLSFQTSPKPPAPRLSAANEEKAKQRAEKELRTNTTATI